MNTKLRLAVTYDCPKKCKLCCNQYHELPESMTIQDIVRSDYKELSITGGEPMIALEDTILIAKWARHQGMKVYLYTGQSFPKKTLASAMRELITNLDGITFTMHEAKDEESFWNLASLVEWYKKLGSSQLSLRLKQFDHFMMQTVPPDDWSYTLTEWVEDCPIPQGEDYRCFNRGGIQ